MREFMLCQNEDGLWVAECRELPGYKAKGKTGKEAIKKINQMLLLIHSCRYED